MELTTIQARDLPDAWFQCIYAILDNGRTYIIDRGSYSGQKRLEFDCIAVHIKFPGARPLCPDIPPSYGIPPPTSMNYVEEYLPYLMTSARKPGEQYTYGQYLEPQIDKVIEMYSRDGHNTNQAYMTVGDPDTLDLEDPPCLRGIDTRIQDGKLHFIIYFRSWDLWGGFPSNLAALQLLKEYMCEQIGVDDGEMIAFSKGLHIYDFAWDLAKMRTMKLGASETR